MKDGRVKFFKELRGFGFITGEDGKELFFHISHRVDLFEDASKEGGLRFGARRAKGRKPESGDPIKYDELETLKGWQAETWAFADTIAALPGLVPSVQRHPCDDGSPDADAHFNRR